MRIFALLKQTFMRKTKPIFFATFACIILFGCNSQPKTTIEKIDLLKKQVATDAKALQAIANEDFTTLQNDFHYCDSMLQYIDAEQVKANFDQLNLWCRENNLSFINNELMVKDKAVITLIRQEVDRLNKSLGDYERVQRFELLSSDWSAGKGEITSTMKIRRDVIQRHYKDKIEKLFT